MKNNDSITDPAKKGRCRWKLTLRILCSLVALIVATLLFLTFWLTPERFSRITSRELSQRLNADFEIHNLRFTFWSTFPRFCLQSDSISVRSRAFDSIPSAIPSLPADADRLASCGRFSGGVNVANLLRGRLRLHNVVAEDLRLNLVAVNDTLANFNIIPQSEHGMERIPEFSANRIAILHPRTISYRSLQSGLTLRADLDSLRLLEQSSSRNTYDVDFAGKADMTAEGLDILTGFPFRMKGETLLSFNPLKVRFRDFGINLGNMSGNANLSLSTAGGGNISDFDYTVESFRLMGLLKFLPPRYTPHISGLNHDLRLTLSASLVGPYQLTSSTLPSIRIRAKVEDGNLSYAFRRGDSLALHHEGLNAVFFFNGKDPSASYVDIPRFSMKGAGIDMDVDARISDILAIPEVKAHIKATFGLVKAAQSLVTLASYSPKGDLSTDAEMDFHVLDPRSLTVRDFRLDATLGGSGLSATLPDGFAIQTDSLSLSGMMKGSFRGISLSDADIRLKGTRMAKNGLRMQFDNIGIKAKYDSLHPAPFKNKSINLAYQPDQRWLDTLSHTPALIELSPSPGMARFFSTRRLSSQIKVGNGWMSIREYPERFRFSGFTLSADQDSVSLNNFGFRSGGSAMRLSASLASVRPLLTERGVHDIPLRADIDIDTLDFNSLAKACDMALTEIKGAGFSKPLPDSITASDMRAWLIPRNISADVNLKADKVYWTNLDISDAKASIKARDGDLAVNGLKMKSTFCHASGSLEFDTRDIQKIDVKTNLAIEDIDFTGMLLKFESLPRHWPELKNLTGVLGVSGTASMHVYPDMAIEMASLTADLNLTGRQLKIHQNKFIHHVCEMMAIRSHKDLHIANIDVNCRVHDNLLELMPCSFEFPRYHLTAVGINDFAGHLDYHLGVLKSPVHIPFGINIGGDYHHPKLRFGGSGWNHKNGAKISSDIEKSFTINLVKEVKSGINEFMDKAAKY